METRLSSFLPDLAAKKPLIIAGPCSAESEDQLVETAKLLARENVHILRAGIWKPRTRPNSFEGVGIVGMEWLKSAKRETNLLTTTEVANAKHVYEALKFDVDILWIGARTTVNPFAVQEIADALKGVDIPVMVKNPINPDVELWIGAIERLKKTGVNKIAAILRGFSTYKNTKYRNEPMWEIAIELKRRLSHLPMICDPSHICGNRELLLEVSQKAMDLDYDGLMLESHINPNEALSDAKQQVTPKRLAKILNELTIRKTTSKNVEFRNHLEELRAVIDEIDEEIIQKISSRMQVSEKIGEYKKDNYVTVLQMKRWSEVSEKRLSLGIAMGLSREFMKKLLQLIHKESIRKQMTVMNRELKIGNT